MLGSSSFCVLLYCRIPVGMEYRCYPFQAEQVLPFLPKPRGERVLHSGTDDTGTEPLKDLSEGPVLIYCTTLNVPFFPPPRWQCQDLQLTSVFVLKLEQPCVCASSRGKLVSHGLSGLAFYIRPPYKFRFHLFLIFFFLCWCRDKRWVWTSQVGKLVVSL